MFFCCCSVIDDISLTNPLCVKCSTRYQHIGVYVIRINAYVYFPFVRNVFLNMFPIFFLFFSFLMRFSDFLISTLKNYSLNLFFLASIFFHWLTLKSKVNNGIFTNPLWIDSIFKYTIRCFYDNFNDFTKKSSAFK